MAIIETYSDLKAFGEDRRKVLSGNVVCKHFHNAMTIPASTDHDASGASFADTSNYFRIGPDIPRGSRILSAAYNISRAFSGALVVNIVLVRKSLPTSEPVWFTLDDTAIEGTATAVSAVATPATGDNFDGDFLLGAITDDVVVPALSIKTASSANFPSAGDTNVSWAVSYIGSNKTDGDA